MSKQPIFIVGAGGHSKVVTDAIDAHSEWNIIAYLDENSKANTFLEKPVFTNLDELKQKFPTLSAGFVAIGNNQIRKQWQITLKKNAFKIPWFSHPSAQISPSATIGPGTLIAAGVILSASATVGEGVILNSGAILDHDSEAGEFCHISQAVILCGGAKVGAECLIGPGCIVEKGAVVPHSTMLPSNSVVETIQL